MALMPALPPPMNGQASRVTEEGELSNPTVNHPSTQWMPCMPTSIFCGGEKETICTICLDELANGVVVREFPCGHLFHKECVDPWLMQKKQTCPICFLGGGTDLENPTVNHPSTQWMPSMPTGTFCGGEKETICTICLDELANGVVVRELPCGHLFHKECVDPWLMQRKQTCPMCLLGGGPDLV